jgi:hypothetical protein
MPNHTDGYHGYDAFKRGEQEVCPDHEDDLADLVYKYMLPPLY